MCKALSYGLLVVMTLWLGCAAAGSRDSAAGAGKNAMRPEVYTLLNAAQRCAVRKDFRCARARLDDVAGIGDLNAYERALRYQLLAFVEFRDHHVDAAITAYEHLLKQPGLPQKLRRQTWYTLAQLHLQRGRADQTLGALQQWFAASKRPRAGAYMLKAQALNLAGRNADALSAAQQAIGMRRAASRPINEHWFQLLAVLYFKTGDDRGAADTLDELIRRSPQNFNYYEQLAGLSVKLGDRARALQLLEAVYTSGRLHKPAELERLAQLLAQAGRGGEAARVQGEDGGAGTR